MTVTPTFENPPIVEFVLGVQFAPLTKMSAGHYGLLWAMLGKEEWLLPGDASPIQDQFELFDRPRWSAYRELGIRLEPGHPIGRFTLRHKDGDRLLQVQPTRFHLNWRKREGFKPSYKSLINYFEEAFSQFREFVVSSGIGELRPNQWELTYVDSFPHEVYWNSPADWANFLPGLFGRLADTDSLGLSLEHRAAEWSFEIRPKAARVHITARPGKWTEDPRDSLILTTTARGPLRFGTPEEIRTGFDLGHDKAVSMFLSVVSEDAISKWQKT